MKLTIEQALRLAADYERFLNPTAEEADELTDEELDFAAAAGAPHADEHPFKI